MSLNKTTLQRKICYLRSVHPFRLILVLGFPPGVPADKRTSEPRCSQRKAIFSVYVFAVISNAFILQQFESFLLVLIDDVGRKVTT